MLQKIATAHGAVSHYLRGTVFLLTQLALYERTARSLLG